jgi:hypothetical protein
MWQLGWWRHLSFTSVILTTLQLTQGLHLTCSSTALKLLQQLSVPAGAVEPLLLLLLLRLQVQLLRGCIRAKLLLWWLVLLPLLLHCQDCSSIHDTMC